MRYYAKKEEINRKEGFYVYPISDKLEPSIWIEVR